MEDATGLDKVFNRVRYYADFETVWASEESEDPLSLATRRVSSELTIVQAKQELSLPLAEAVQAWRPEVFFHPTQGAESSAFDCGLERLLAPGDALGWLSIDASVFDQRISSMMSLVFGMAAGDQDKGKGGETVPVRITLRRDFPEAGQSTVALVPRDPSCNELVEEWGRFKAVAIAMRQHDTDPSRTVLIACKKLRAPFAFPQVAPTFGRFLWRILRGAHERFHRLRASESYFTVLEATSYVVVALRKCTKGSPLLPKLRGSASIVEQCFEWERYECDGIDLPGYLRAFLECIGIEVPIFDSLDGRRLVPYQAAVPKGAWAWAGAAMLEPFKSQRRAYRRLMGGAVPPEVVPRPEPRFRGEDRGREDEQAALPVRGTFIHMSQAGRQNALDRPALSPRRRTVDDFSALQQGVTVC